MTRKSKVLIGCGSLAGIFAVLCGAAIWWFQRGGPVGDRVDLVGPQTQAFVTFLAAPEDRTFLEVVDSLKRRSSAPSGEKRAELLSSFGDLLSGARIYQLRASAMVETLDGDRSEVGLVVSLGKMANLVRMLLGIADSERETESYRKERIVHGHDRQDLSMSFVGNNLILSRDPHAIRILIDRLKKAVPDEGPSKRMLGFLQDVDPNREMPGYGALINERASLASLWQTLTGAPEGSGISLPPTFQGVGFCFGFASADVLRGNGYFYFEDDEAAEGAIPQLRSALSRMCEHFQLKPRIEIEQEGSRLRVTVEASEVQTAIDHYLAPKPRGA